MKIWYRLILLAVVTMLLAATVTPALADNEVTLTIRNLTQSSVELTLNGPTKLKITIVQDITKVRLKPGTYSYRYEACNGRRYSGTLQVVIGKTFKLVKCEKGLNATLVINNLTGKTFSLLLNGPKVYNLSIIPGDHKYTVQAGRYEYRAFVCGAVQTGERGLKSKNNQDWIWRCNK